MCLRRLSALPAATFLAAAISAVVGARPTPAASGVVAPAASSLTWPEVLRYRAARDYFAMRDRVEALSGEDRVTPPARFARALVEHAFNAPAASNVTIGALLADGRLPDSLAAALRRVQVANHLRLSAYAAGLAAVDTVLADSARPGTALDAAAVRDLRNTRRIFRALAGVPPQTVAVRGPAALRLQGGRAPVRVNGSARHYVFDTGANLSTIMRSEARALGLRLYPAGIDVGTSTDRRVSADLGVADRLTLGRAEYRHVVFLVLDDSLLTFPGGFRIPGIVGFPVIEQLGEVQLGRDGALVIPGPRPARPTRGPRNLALDELTPLTRVRWAGARDGAGDTAPLLCRLDTGAQRTQFYEPFYRRHRARLDGEAPPTTRGVGGAGGVRELAVRVLPRPRLAVGDTVAVLDSADVLTQPITRDAAENYLDCNIGHDVLDAFPRYVIDFRGMSFLLR